MSERATRVLLIDDDRNEYLIIRGLLRRSVRRSYDLDWVASYASGLDRIQDSDHDAYLVDYQLGDGNGVDLTREAIAAGCRQPILILTGHTDQDEAALAAGATDYLLKGEVDADRFDRALRYAIARKQVEAERDRLIVELRQSLSTVKTLSGLLPICSYCKKVRADKGYWQSVETYLNEHLDNLQFSHGCCPDCMAKIMAALDEAAGDP